MSTSLAHVLLASNIAASVAVLVVAALRKSLRRITGPQSAYWVWLLVPATALAAFLPAPAYRHPTVPGALSEVLANAVVTVTATGASTDYLRIGLTMWLAGVLVAAATLMVRQRAFVRSLGRMRLGPDGILCSDFIVGPMVLGAWRARVIVPTDFAARYTPEERLLMLAHERAHLERGDALLNVVAAAWLCLFWFNPLMYWALGRLHFDQELACDALVIARRASGKKLYASALLKAQMYPESTWRTPLGCRWKSRHPLKERIAVLKYPVPGIGRRVGGVAIAVALCISGVYAVTAASGAALNQDAPASAAQVTGGDWLTKSMDLDIHGQNIREVLLEIARKSGHTVLFSDGAQQRLKEHPDPVQMHFVDIQVKAVLNLIAQLEHLSIKQSGNVIFVDIPTTPASAIVPK